MQLARFARRQRKQRSISALCLLSTALDAASVTKSLRPCIGRGGLGGTSMRAGMRLSWRMIANRVEEVRIQFRGDALDLSEFENVEASPGEITLMPRGISTDECGRLELNYRRY